MKFNVREQHLHLPLKTAGRGSQFGRVLTRRSSKMKAYAVLEISFHACLKVGYNTVAVNKVQ